MSAVRIILPDGNEKKLEPGATSLDLAQAISPQLLRRVVAARVNGELKDLQDPLKDGDRVVLLDNKSDEAKDIINHSCEHILAAAVLDLFPKAQVAMGPKDHSHGFYYDFDIDRPFTDDDLIHIEKRMASLIKGSIFFKKRWLTKAEAKKLFIDLEQVYKPEILDWIESDVVTVYESGHFADLCRGPHLPNAGFIKAFKLLGNSGSYWRGDSSKRMLQRINGIAFNDKAALDEYLFKVEEGKRRDHRKLGPKHELFFVSERFGTWENPNATISEARLLLHFKPSLMESSRMDSSVAELFGLLRDLKQSMPSGSLELKSFNANPSAAVEDKVLADLRIFACPKDDVAKKAIKERLAQFNQGSDDMEVKLHFDSHANEEIGPGLVMWLPHGGRLRSLVEDFSRRRHFAYGYEMVYSPHVAKSDLWRISGHLGFYHDTMFAPMNVDGNEYLLKPMNCPFHVLMYKWKPHSYRDLPIRLAEFGTVYRYELAGVLHGLMRVRGFTQDDAHIFCRWDQLDQELNAVIAFVIDMLKAFGFRDFEVNISTRPEKFVGEVEQWDRAEVSLKDAVSRSGLEYGVDEGGGAFYGPKIDIKLKDSLDRLWQCSTIQLDFNNPERFDLEYVNSSGQKERPVMLHRALFGSIERFIGILIEHYSGAFPAWLAPEQVRILTVSDRHLEHAELILSKLKGSGIRAHIPDSHEKLGAKIRKAQIDKVALMVIVGDEEVLKKGGSLRLRSGDDIGFLGVSELMSRIKEYCSEPEI